MILDMTQKLTDLDGKVLKEGDEDVILRKACVNALMAVLPKDNDKTGDQKLAIFSLAKRITDEDTPDLAVEDLALIKERVGTAFGPAIVGPVFPMLNGTPATPKLVDKDKK